VVNSVTQTVSLCHGGAYPGAGSSILIAIKRIVSPGHSLLSGEEITMGQHEDRNKQIVRRLYEEVGNEGRLEVLDEITWPDHVEHNPLPGQSQGAQGLKQRVSMVRAAHDPHFTIEHLLADGDKVAVMWTNRGTHVADWMGIPATGKSTTIQGVDIHLLRHGRLAEHWDVVDIYSFLVQIGGVPAPTGAAETAP
jgi:predicted ester cyclase